MRIVKLVLAGSLAVMAAAAPALAKNPEQAKSDDKSTTSVGCQAYQQAADGTWSQLPCGESGNTTATQHRSPAKTDEDTH